MWVSYCRCRKQVFLSQFWQQPWRWQVPLDAFIVPLEVGISVRLQAWPQTGFRACSVFGLFHTDWETLLLIKRTCLFRGCTGCTERKEVCFWGEWLRICGGARCRKSFIVEALLITCSYPCFLVIQQVQRPCIGARSPPLHAETELADGMRSASAQRAVVSGDIFKNCATRANRLQQPQRCFALRRGLLSGYCLIIVSGRFHRALHVFSGYGYCKRILKCLKVAGK